MANVLSLIPYNIFPPKLGGQKGIALFNQYLSQHHNLICVTIKNNDPRFASYKVFNILSDSKFRYLNFLYFFKVRKIIHENRITDLIIEHPYLGWLGILLKWFCNVQLFVHSHNIEGLRFKSNGKWWWRILLSYEAYVHRNANFTFCITSEDRLYMIKKMWVTPANSMVVTYGIEMESPPSYEEKIIARRYLESEHGISQESFIFLFNGTLDYAPNLSALQTILFYINPIFRGYQIPYKIIICGKNLPDHMENLKSFQDDNIIYAGFVDDISVYFKGSDVFINPIVDGGGIKTKLVEALGNNMNAVSTENGAIGINPEICNDKLYLVKGLDWNDFALKMRLALYSRNSIPELYYEHFSWKNIAVLASGCFRERDG